MNSSDSVEDAAVGEPGTLEIPRSAALRKVLNAALLRTLVAIKRTQVRHSCPRDYQVLSCKLQEMYDKRMVQLEDEIKNVRDSMQYLMRPVRRSYTEAESTSRAFAILYC